MDLSSEPVRPHSHDKPPLTRREIADLVREVQGWSVEDGHLVRRFEFKSFQECLQFVNEVANLAASEGHIPDICITAARKVKVSWYTYGTGGLTMNDFIMAARLNNRITFRLGGAL